MENSSPKNQRCHSPILRVFLLCAGTLAVVFSAALLGVNCPFVQNWYWVHRLAKSGIEARFEEVCFGVLFSDSVRARNAEFVFPDGRRIRVKSFSARHGSARSLFVGAPVFREISCEELSVDARERELCSLNFFAEEFCAGFSPLDLVKNLAQGESLPFSLGLKKFAVQDARTGATLAEGDFALDFSGEVLLSSSGKVCGDAAGVLALPGFSKLNNLAAGKFEIRGEGETLNVELRELRSRVGNVKVDKIRLRGKKTGNFSGTLNVEIVASRTTLAEVDFSHFRATPKSLEFCGEMNAEVLDAVDLFHVGALFYGWKKPSRETAFSPSQKIAENPQTPLSPPAKNRPFAETNKPASVPANTFFRGVPAEKPFWHGVSGTLKFHIEKAYYPRNEVGAHDGVFFVDEKCMKMNHTFPEFFGGTASGCHAIEFRDAFPHYLFEGDFSGKNVEIHRALPLLRSREPAAIDGRFDLAWRARATADLPESLESALVAELDVKSSAPGRVRIFKADSKKMRVAEGALNLGGKLAGMLGGLTRHIDPRAARITEVFGVLKEAFSDFSYNEMHAETEYSVGGNAMCKNFVITGDEVRISGCGTARPIKGEAPERWPMDFKVDVAARGNVAEAMRELGLLREKEASVSTDSSFAGFFPGPHFEFTGTAADISAHFFETLADAVSGKNVSHKKDSRRAAESIFDVLVDE